jgi:hypothetical protein
MTMEHGLIISILRDLAWLTAGALAGVAYFLGLRWSIQLQSGGRLLVPLGLQLPRFGILAVALAVIAKSFGALPLLLATVGLRVARTAVIRWEGSRD